VQIAADRLEPGARRGIVPDVQDQAAAVGIARGQHLQALAQRFGLCPGHRLAPDAAAQLVEQRRDGTGGNHASVEQDGEPRAKLGDIVEEMRGEDHERPLADLGEQVVEACALGRIETGGRLVDDHQVRLAEQGLGDAEAAAHAAGEARHPAPAHLVEVGPLQQRMHLLAPRSGRTDALQHGQVIEQLLGREPRVDAELLRQVAQHAPQPVRLCEDIHALEGYAAAAGALQGGDDAHQRGLARPVRPEQAVDAARHVEVDVVQRAHAPWIGVRESTDLQRLRAGRRGGRAFGLQRRHIVHDVPQRASIDSIGTATATPSRNKEVDARCLHERDKDDRHRPEASSGWLLVCIVVLAPAPVVSF